VTVVVNGRFLHDRPTGIGRVGRSWLTALRDAGTVGLDVVAPPAVTDALVDRTVGGVPGRLGGAVWEQVALPRVARGRTVLSLANTAPLLARPSVTTVHDLTPLVDAGWFHPRMQVYARVTLAAARRAALVVAVSRVVAHDLADRGVAADRVTVVHPAVDAGFRPASAAAVAASRARFGIVGPYLLVVGAHDPRKDAALVVRAHARLLAAYPHQLVLVGEPHANLGSVDLPTWPSIVPVGRVPDDDLVALLTDAAALAFPSRAEGFGLPPLEAAACGTVAVVSDLPVLRESAPTGTTFVAAGDVSGWTDALAAALAGELVAGAAPTRTAADAAAELTRVLEGLA